jgi:hypothetical protein
VKKSLLIEAFLVMTLEEKIIKKIGFNPRDKEECLKALQEKEENIYYIKDPTEEMQLEVVRRYGGYIQFINNPTEKVQLKAVKSSPYSIQHIKDPSEEVKLEAVKRDGIVIQFINNPSEKIQLEAIKHSNQMSDRIIRFIKQPSKKVQLEVIKINNYNINIIALCPNWRELKEEIESEMLIKKFLE